MLKHEITKQENAVEEYFCKPFENTKRYPMGEEDCKFLITLLMGSPDVQLSENEKPFIVKIVESRVKASYSYKIEDTRLHLFIGIVSESPGTAIMYLTYLQYWCKKNNCRELNLEKFCEIFPNGFPSRDDLHKIWEGQKVLRPKEGFGSDNLLDYQSAMVSIQFEKVEQV